MKPSKDASPQLIKALTEIAARIAAQLVSADRKHLPVRMYLAGGAAVHFYTGARMTGDVDAVFSTRVVLPEDLDVAYVDEHGRNRLLYFDRQYNDTFALLHEDAHRASKKLTLHGVDPGLLEVRALAPVDLAVSKIARYEQHDQDDIAALARAGLITGPEVEQRAQEALAGYVGNVSRVHLSIKLARQLIETNIPTAPSAPPAKSRKSGGRRR